MLISRAATHRFFEKKGMMADVATGKATAAQRIFRLLQDRILSGEFAPGSPLREEELAAGYTVSRHVIREVLRGLASEGLADYASYRGARVPLLGAAEIEDVFQARQFLECGVLARDGHRADVRELAAIHGRFAAAVTGLEWREAFRVDVRFHSYIVGLSGSPRLVKCHLDLMQSLSLAHLVAPDFIGSGLTASVPQHAEIVLAIAAADLPRAVAALGDHIDHAKRLLLEGESRRSAPLPHAARPA